jgi:hypothetical protein
MLQENYITYASFRYTIKTVISIPNLLRFIPHYLINSLFYEQNGANPPLQFSCYANMWIKIVHKV